MLKALCPAADWCSRETLPVRRTAVGDGERRVFLKPEGDASALFSIRGARDFRGVPGVPRRAR